MSKDINKKNGNLNLLIYGVFFVMLVLIAGGVLVLTNYLFNAGFFEDLILVALIFLMLSLLIAPLNILFVIAKTSYYQLFAKAQVNAIIEELKKSTSKAKKDE
jgi:cytochrome b subunit of formate dehydrogenase